MRPAHPTERAVGIDHYVSEADGTGGRLRDRPADFRVTELEAVDAAPVDADPGSYPHLVVRATLTDWDTNDFAKRLSDALGISRERVSWAGTKDKRAVTTQLFSVRGVDATDLPGTAVLDPDRSDASGDAPSSDASDDGIDGVELDVVGRTGRPVLFGDLAGNEFRVVVRDPERPGQADAVAGQLARFAETGGDPAAVGEATGFESGDEVAVPNYFGQQRFGSIRPVTHEVGLAIVRDDWEGAVLAYVGNPHEDEPADTREARRYVERTRDWRGAIERFPRRLGYERAILNSLADCGTDPDPAAFRAALESLPTNLQGLFVHAAQSYAFNRILSERLRDGLPLGRPVEGDVVCFTDRAGPADFPLPDTDRTQRVTAGRVETVARHCRRGRAFVTVPLVGTDTDLAAGRPGEIERSVLSDLDLSPADFDLPGAFDSAGDRRATLVRTDLRVDRDPPTFAFALPRGSYATVVLREFLKVDPREIG